MSDETWDAWSRGYLEGQTCVCRQVTDEIRADERRRVLDEIETFMDNGATGWQNLRDYIARMRQEAGQ